MTDESLMPFGVHKGKALANVPTDYLVWLYDNKKVTGQLKVYIETHVPLIIAQVKAKEKGKL